MRRRWGIAVTAWVVAAVLTTLVGVAAVESLGNGILGSPEQPLSGGDVASQLASSPENGTTSAAGSPSAEASPSAAPTPTDEPTPPTSAPPPTQRVLASRGGTVLASCSGGLVTLLSWSPAQGYQVVRVERGPATRAEIRFGHGHDEDRNARIRVVCRNGRPEAGED